MTEQSRLIVLRALGLGDILTVVPALRAIRRAFPQHHRVIATPAAYAPLLLGEDLADEICPSHDLEPLDATHAEPDIAIDLHGKGPGSQPLLVALQPRRLIAFAHPEIPDTAGGPQWRPGEHEVRRWCRLLSESGIPAYPGELDISPPPGSVPSELAGATVIHPGAASPARRWPPERFAAVARSELEAGRTVMVTGSTAERPSAMEMAGLAGLDARCVLAGRTNLVELTRLVAAAGRLVCGDTGIAHLGTALGTPSVILFGPVPPTEWGPPPERPQHVALWAGRRGDPHGTSPDPGLLELTVDQVTAALGALERGPGRLSSTLVGETW